MFFQSASSKVHQLSPDREHGLCEGQVGDAERRSRELEREHRNLQCVQREGQMNVPKVIITMSLNSEVTHMFISLSRSENNF